MSDKELERELKQINKEFDSMKDVSKALKTLQKILAKRGLPDNLEEALRINQQRIDDLEAKHPEAKKKREELLRRFPQLKDMEG